MRDEEWRANVLHCKRFQCTGVSGHSEYSRANLFLCVCRLSVLPAAGCPVVRVVLQNLASRATFVWFVNDSTGISNNSYTEHYETTDDHKKPALYTGADQKKQISTTP